MSKLAKVTCEVPATESGRNENDLGRPYATERTIVVRSHGDDGNVVSLQLAGLTGDDPHKFLIVDGSALQAAVFNAMNRGR